MTTIAMRRTRSRATMPATIATTIPTTTAVDSVAVLVVAGLGRS
jgi:hypothetical protein